MNPVKKYTLKSFWERDECKSCSATVSVGQEVFAILSLNKKKIRVKPLCSQKCAVSFQKKRSISLDTLPVPKELP